MSEFDLKCFFLVSRCFVRHQLPVDLHVGTRVDAGHPVCYALVRLHFRDRETRGVVPRQLLSQP